MSKARDDEWTFVLLERDAAAPAAVRAWIEERVKLGKNARSDGQIKEAEQWIRTVESPALGWRSDVHESATRAAEYWVTRLGVSKSKVAAFTDALVASIERTRAEWKQRHPHTNPPAVIACIGDQVDLTLAEALHTIGFKPRSTFAMTKVTPTSVAAAELLSLSNSSDDDEDEQYQISQGPWRALWVKPEAN